MALSIVPVTVVIVVKHDCGPSTWGRVSGFPELLCCKEQVGGVDRVGGVGDSQMIVRFIARWNVRGPVVAEGSLLLLHPCLIYPCTDPMRTVMVVAVQGARSIIPFFVRVVEWSPKLKRRYTLLRNLRHSLKFLRC